MCCESLIFLYLTVIKSSPFNRICKAIGEKKANSQWLKIFFLLSDDFMNTKKTPKIKKTDWDLGDFSAMWLTKNVLEMRSDNCYYLVNAEQESCQRGEADCQRGEKISTENQEVTDGCSVLTEPDYIYLRNKKNINTKKEYIYSDVVNALNQKAQTNYRATSRQTKRLIDARLSEGFSLEDFLRVIETKVNDWSGTEMEKYIRPETLFGNKFEGYLNEPTAEEKNSPFTRAGLALIKANEEKMRREVEEEERLRLASGEPEPEQTGECMVMTFDPSKYPGMF